MMVHIQHKDPETGEWNNWDSSAPVGQIVRLLHNCDIVVYTITSDMGDTLVENGEFRTKST